MIVDAATTARSGLKRAGGYMTDAGERERIRNALWPDGKLSRTLIARDADVFARGCGLPKEAESARFFMVEETGVGRDHPFSGEKLSLALAVYRAPDFEAAIGKVNDILAFQGRGHSCGLHTKDMKRARTLAERAGVVRVRINQAHSFGKGGGFDNGLNFTLSMGCGTGRQQHHREPELPPLPQHHAPRDDDPGGQAGRGGAVRRLLAEIREVRGL